MNAIGARTEGMFVCEQSCRDFVGFLMLGVYVQVAFGKEIVKMGK